MDDTTITPEEHAYLENISKKVMSKISSEELNLLQISALVAAVDFTVLRAYILMLIAKGYMMRDEKELYKNINTKLSSDDFLDKK